MEKFNGIYVGLDVHKATIAVAVVRGLRSQAQYFGEIANTPAEIKKLVKRLSPEGEVMNFCYEAGACGYEVYHQLKKLGQDCDVVAPSLGRALLDAICERVPVHRAQLVQDVFF